jgi:hypothetical protein
VIQKQFQLKKITATVFLVYQHPVMKRTQLEPWKVLGSIFNPADMLYNFFGKKPKKLKNLKEMKRQ